MKEPNYKWEIKAKRAIQLSSHNNEVLMRDNFIYVEEITEIDKELERQGAIIITPLKKEVKVVDSGETVTKLVPKVEKEKKTEESVPTSEKPKKDSRRKKKRNK